MLAFFHFLILVGLPVPWHRCGVIDVGIILLEHELLVEASKYVFIAKGQIIVFLTANYH